MGAEIELPKSSLAAADAFMKADQVVNHMGYSKIAVSVSGGSDSDVVVDIISKVDRDRRCTYRYFDTGMEYEATERHLGYLERRYGIAIERVQPVEKVAKACRTRGLPIFSKHIAQSIGVLQGVGFPFDGTPEGELLDRYSGDRIMRHVKWWTNGYTTDKGGVSRYTVANRKWLKEFIMDSPPSFKVSDQCCLYAKKLTAQRDHERHGYEVDIIGVRRAEGGVRANPVTTCFSPDNAGHGSHGYAVYRPVWWFSNADKEAYEREAGIVHSDCYGVYGFKRTGCALCPFAGRNLWHEMEAVKVHEPRLYRAAWAVFGDSYEYLAKYEEFRRRMDDMQAGTQRLF